MAEPSYWVTPYPTWNPATAGDWVELADMNMPGSGGTYSRDDASESIVGHVPYAKRYDARRKILGYAYADSGTPYYLRRVNPFFHPDELQLRADSVDIRGYNLQGYDPGGGAAMTSSDAAFNAALGGFQTRPHYARAELSIRFRPHPFPYLTDADMLTYAAANGYATRLPEYYRNCSIFDTMDPVLQVISAGSEPYMRWIDTPLPGSGGPAPFVPDAHGVLVENTTNLDKGEVPILISQAQLAIVWHDVPLDYIANPYLPSKIMNCVGKVNSNGFATTPVTDAPWLGFFPRGTLKMEAPRIKKTVQSQIRTNSPFFLPFLCDVIFPLSYTNPLMAGLVGAVKPTFQGWNAFLWNRTAQSYAIARISDSTKGVFEYADFDTAFQSVLA